MPGRIFYVLQVWDTQQAVEHIWHEAKNIWASLRAWDGFEVEVPSAPRHVGGEVRFVEFGLTQQ